MILACLDLEGVLIPEIWVSVAASTGVDELRLTTREVPDYDELMRYRLDILDRSGIRLADIQRVIADLEPLPGAAELMNWLRERFQVIILSDTYYEFGMPFMAQLGHPTLMCHKLKVDDAGRITDYVLRLPDQKRQSVRHFHQLNFKVIAAGDSYNDTTMLAEADAGILFRPPQTVIDEFPQFPIAWDYIQMRDEFTRAAKVLG